MNSYELLRDTVNYYMGKHMSINLVNLDPDTANEIEIIAAIIKSDGYLVELLRDRIIYSNCYLSRVGLKYLPEGLVVHGNLRLSWCKDLEELPDDLIIYGDLNLCGCEKLKFPKKLYVGGDLNLSGTPPVPSDANYYVGGMVYRYENDEDRKYCLENT